ncbi:hypothetical protein ACFSUS_21460 [Spirosoma soli]|uniref:Uncharacterized protein n=1 Tax=Spirosoma soli TaxID=1770529 RepID=A0ABW5M8F8_9BACT
MKSLLIMLLGCSSSVLVYAQQPASSLKTSADTEATKNKTVTYEQFVKSQSANTFANPSVLPVNLDIPASTSRQPLFIINNGNTNEKKKVKVFLNMSAESPIDLRTIKKP